MWTVFLWGGCYVQQDNSYWTSSLVAFYTNIHQISYFEKNPTKTSNILTKYPQTYTVKAVKFQQFMYPHQNAKFVKAKPSATYIGFHP